MQLKVFLETLGVSQSPLSGVPPHLRLPVAVTCYWLRHAHPLPDQPLLQALLLGLVYGELCRQRKSQRGMAQSMNEKTHYLELIDIEVCEVQPLTPPFLCNSVYGGTSVEEAERADLER